MPNDEGPRLPGPKQTLCVAERLSRRCWKQCVAPGGETNAQLRGTEENVGTGLRNTHPVPTPVPASRVQTGSVLAEGGEGSAGSMPVFKRTSQNSERLDKLLRVT